MLLDVRYEARAYGSREEILTELDNNLGAQRSERRQRQAKEAIEAINAGVEQVQFGKILYIIEDWYVYPSGQRASAENVAYLQSPGEHTATLVVGMRIRVERKPEPNGIRHCYFINGDIPTGELVTSICAKSVVMATREKFDGIVPQGIPLCYTCFATRHAHLYRDVPNPPKFYHPMAVDSDTRRG